ncbi:hypothetical protein N658DRAFT_187562 [Parathielavia hyrcaniae]|uniref:Uncharacterized protein n=1 Tax=Parathielavia hyrcaniae TaxID=113614 RepID=A0AAN6T4D2_9PEZI|nr:hypothetical protein N658DRAFT_187562 [Parathielavia hyrcaniae]
MLGTTTSGCSFASVFSAFLAESLRDDQQASCGDTVSELGAWPVQVPSRQSALSSLLLTLCGWTTWSRLLTCIADTCVGVIGFTHLSSAPTARISTSSSQPAGRFAGNACWVDCSLVLFSSFRPPASPTLLYAGLGGSRLPSVFPLCSLPGKRRLGWFHRRPDTA